MPLELQLYVVAWALLCVGAVALVCAQGRGHPLLSPAYLRFLGRPWKVVTFALSCTCITLMAPYTGDPTWDHCDALLMAVLTFWTAPFAVGTLHRAARGLVRWRQVYVAACAWMFSASWCYDLYLLLRDGQYPMTWAANIGASSVLYATAGLLWNLKAEPGVGVVFAFREADWPQPGDTTSFRSVAWFALPFMLLVTGLLLPFLLAR